MQTILIAIILLIKIIIWFIIIDIILSWLSLLAWKRLKINFINSIIDPLYKFVRKYIPTKLWIFDFSPIILFFALSLIEWLIYAYDPSLQFYFHRFF